MSKMTHDERYMRRKCRGAKLPTAKIMATQSKMVKGRNLSIIFKAVNLYNAQVPTAMVHILMQALLFLISRTTSFQKVKTLNGRNFKLVPLAVIVMISYTVSAELYQFCLSIRVGVVTCSNLKVQNPGRQNKAQFKAAI